jgi:hypothetical protein
MTVPQPAVGHNSSFQPSERAKERDGILHGHAAPLGQARGNGRTGCVLIRWVRIKCGSNVWRNLLIVAELKLRDAMCLQLAFFLDARHLSRAVVGTAAFVRTLQWAASLVASTILASLVAEIRFGLASQSVFPSCPSWL